MVVNSNSKIICADLDGIILKSDLLYESLLWALRHKPSILFLVPFWLLKGRAHLKYNLSREVNLNYASLPYNIEAVAYLSEAKKRGDKIILATAASEILASGVARHLNIFDEYFGSSK